MPRTPRTPGAPGARKGATPRPRLYFGYGANTNRPSMAQRCPAARFIGTASLTGYRLCMRGVADIEPAAGSGVHGAVWEITPACERSLDAFEGFPVLYGKQTVTLDDGRKALVYVMAAGRPLSPARGGYFDVVEAGYRGTGLPRDQLHAAEARAEKAWKAYVRRVASRAAA